MISGQYFTSRNMCSACLLLFVTLFVAISGQNNSPNNLATTSECYNYKVSSSGLYLANYYTCCQKPTTTGTESPCKEPEPIANFQCAEEKSIEEKNVTKKFDCKGQIGQKNAMQRCTRRWAWLQQQTGDRAECWAWSECFAGACAKEEDTIGSSLKEDFCGDGKCDSFTEDGDSCPIDCCPYENPDECQVVNNTCTDPCCGQPLCCKIPASSSSILLWIIVGVAGFIVLLNLCCCFFCVCCSKRCCKKLKKNKHDKKKQKNTAV